MDDHRRTGPEDKKKDTAEGVRIIGPDEAAEAMERDDVATRRADDELRFGDRPPAPPEGSRPKLRFPLDSSADPARVERPPVQPAPDPVTGPVELPHWTEPPTGEVPAVLIGDDKPLLGDDGEELDAWSSFATTSPRWRDADDDWGDDGYVEHLAGDPEPRAGALADADSRPSHDEYHGFEDFDERVEERTGDHSVVDDEGPRFDLPDDNWAASAEEPEPEPEPVLVGGRGDDRTSFDDRPSQRVPMAGPHSGRVDRVDLSDDEFPPSGGDRDLGTAAAVGIGLVAVALISLFVYPAAFVVVAAAALGLCAIEYFDVLRKVGWESAHLFGIAAVALFPLAIYWKGPGAYGLLAALTVIGTLGWYLAGAGGRDPRVLEGSGATLLGVFWIGGLGSAAAAMAALPDGKALVFTAVLATAAHDVAALFGGRAFGRHPLSPASPKKTWEGVGFGFLAALVITVVVVGIAGKGPWHGMGPALVLGIGAGLAAPLGDLCQSLLKRDLGVKDMGTLLPGHGGMLDRLDSMLFVMPVLYWLVVTLGR